MKKFFKMFDGFKIKFGGDVAAKLQESAFKEYRSNIEYRFAFARRAWIQSRLFVNPLTKGTFFRSLEANGLLSVVDKKSRK